MEILLGYTETRWTNRNERLNISVVKKNLMINE
jgi:hypothetical protein